VKISNYLNAAVFLATIISFCKLRLQQLRYLFSQNSSHCWQMWKKGHEMKKTKVAHASANRLSDVRSHFWLCGLKPTAFFDREWNRVSSPGVAVAYTHIKILIGRCHSKLISSTFLFTHTQQQSMDLPGSAWRSIINLLHRQRCARSLARLAAWRHGIRELPLSECARERGCVSPVGLKTSPFTQYTNTNRRLLHFKQAPNRERENNQLLCYLHYL